MATWKDFVKAAQQNTVSKVTSNVIPALVPKPAPKPAPKLEYPKHYIGPSTKTPSDTRVASIGPAKDRSYNPDLGFYGLLGNPGLQRALDAGYDAAQASGSTAARIAAGLGRLPERTVTAAGGAALSGAALKSLFAADNAATSAFRYLSKIRTPMTVAVGAGSGIKHGIESGSVAEGLEHALRNASYAYMLGGGGIIPPSVGIGMSSASENIRNTGSIPYGLTVGARDAAISGILGKLYSMFPMTTTLGLTSYNVVPAVADGHRANQEMEGVFANEDAQIRQLRENGDIEEANKRQIRRDAAYQAWAKRR